MPGPAGSAGRLAVIDDKTGGRRLEAASVSPYVRESAPVPLSFFPPLFNSAGRRVKTNASRAARAACAVGRRLTQHLSQQLTDAFRIGLTAAGFHDLTDQHIDHLGLAGLNAGH